MAMLVLLFTPGVLAANQYQIQDTTLSYDAVDWSGEEGDWVYAKDMYELIWGVSFDESFHGDVSNGNNMIQKLTDEERLFTVEHTEIFIKSAVPGAVIRIANGNSGDANFDIDGLQEDGTYGHSMIIAAIYDEGFIAFESLSGGAREHFYTWEDFYDTWSGDAHQGQSRYIYYRYIKWPSAPVLTLAATEETVTNSWGGFLCLFVLGVLLLGAGIAAMWFLRGRRGPKINWLSVLVFLVPLCLGLFFAWSCAICCVVLLCGLFWEGVRNGKLRIALNEQLVIAILLPVAYLLTSIWGVDSGLTPMGAVKFLVVPLFVLCLQQYDTGVKRQIREMIPCSGAFLVLVSALLACIPVTRGKVIVAGRFAGLFQYPNAFALFLLLGLIVLSYQRPRWKNIVSFLILFSGLLFTGSRTVYLLTLAVALIRICTLSGIKQRMIAIGAIGAAAALSFVVALLLPESPVSRLLAISLESSTFLGRFLYFKDAIQEILRHPFGLGFLGYYYHQGSFQTGVYSVMFVHNEFLQLLLDIGWVPALLVIVFLLKNLFSRGISWENRLLLFAILAHSQFDFSLQFVIIWMLLCCCTQPGHVFAVWEPRSVSGLVPVVLVLGGFCVALGTANFLETYGESEKTLWAYPNDTAALMQLLIHSSDAAEMDQIADRILALDECVSVAYSAKASVAYASGDVVNMVRYKEAAISNAVYEQAEYQDYFAKLQQAAALFQSSNNQDGVRYCQEKIREIPTMMASALSNASALAWKIEDNPQLELTGEQQEYLASLDE